MFLHHLASVMGGRSQGQGEVRRNITQKCQRWCYDKVANNSKELKMAETNEKASI